MIEAEETPSASGTGERTATAFEGFLWTLPQPLLAVGALTLVASAAATHWVDPDLLTNLLLLIPIPALMIAERLKPKRGDWVLNWKEYAEDTFWLFSVFVIWAPLYGNYYDTPVSEAFVWLRETVAFPYALEPATTLGIMGAAMIAVFLSEFIYYWLHRLQHRMLFFWRIHATHHHITKMAVARADRTHPLEFLALNLGPAIVLAFLGASDDVIAAALVFRLVSGHINHANLPLRSGLYGLIFTTAEWHQLHHSKEIAESDRNFGCTVILWDRLFGTFSPKKHVETIGNGTGEALSLWMQLTLPFRSNETLRRL